MICAFDCETSNVPGTDQAVVYIWQACLYGIGTFYGREISEFPQFLNLLDGYMPEGYKLVFFVHNLSFDFWFLAGVLPFSSDDVFAVKSRKILKAVYADRFEFRCSYLQTNMGLAEFTKKMNVEHQKLPDYDYEGVRYPWTPLSEFELAYCENDVLGLCEAISKEMAMECDTLLTIPLTSTGYVRRDFKAAMKRKTSFLKSCTIDVELCRMLEEAFRGGDTHANRYYVTDDVAKIHHDVKSYDMASAYPAAQLTRRFPMSAFLHKGAMTQDKLDEYILSGKAVVFRAAFHHLRLRDQRIGYPYISKSKCRLIDPATDYDNGRILYSKYLETTLTDIDYNIICSDYDFSSIAILDSYTARYGYLPEEFTQTVTAYFEKKTQLKGVPEQEYFYNRSKAKLNSLYGMCAQTLITALLLMVRDEYGNYDFVYDQSKTFAELIEKNQRWPFRLYQWGVWTTAHCRAMLHEALDLVSAHNSSTSDFIYCDTDSVKFIGTADFSALNAERQQLAEARHAYADDPAGNRHYMGVYEYEGSYDDFVTMGAKKYAYNQGGKLHITTAGVHKRKGAVELQKAGGITNYHAGFTFTEAGGTRSIYNDAPPISEVEIDGHKLRITGNVSIQPSTYTLGLSGEFEVLVMQPDFFKKLARDLNFWLDYPE